MSLFDYGGQSVFNIFSLRNMEFICLCSIWNGSYLLRKRGFIINNFSLQLHYYNMYNLFPLVLWPDANLLLLLSLLLVLFNQGLSYLSFWLNSVVVHIIHGTIQLRKPLHLYSSEGKEILPVILINIFKFLHYYILFFLPIWHGLLFWTIKMALDQMEEWTYTFFPIDNKLGRDDANLKCLLSVVEKKLLDSSYVHEEKPLSWLLKAFDKLMGEKIAWVSTSWIYI